MESRPLIFLCYARLDFDKVESLSDRLLAAGFRPWMDKKNILSEERPKASIQEAIRSSDFFFACLSNNAVSENGILTEEIQKPLNFLWKRVDSYSYLVPIRLEECPIPEDLIAFDTVIDLFNNDGWDKLLGVIELVKANRSGLVENNLDIDLSVFESRVQEKMTEASLEGPDNPSFARDWGIDLRRLLNGERENALLIHGGAVEYTQVMLAEAEDQAAASEAFHEALNNLVQTWQPSGFDSDYYAALMLDLVGAYTPLTGFNKVIDFIYRQRYFIQSEAAGEFQRPDDDLYLKALVVLENYYRVPPLPPEDEAPAYQTYIDILREDFLRHEYCGYALKRMVQLKVIQLDSPEIENLIKRNPQSLNELLNLLLDPNKRSTAERDLTLVYMACLDAGSEIEAYFEQAVMVCGGQLERKEHGPIIILDDESILLNLTEEAQNKYWGFLMDQEAQEGLEKYNSMSG